MTTTDKQRHTQYISVEQNRMHWIMHIKHAINKININCTYKIALVHCIYPGKPTPMRSQVTHYTDATNNTSGKLATGEIACCANSCL